MNFDVNKPSDLMKYFSCPDRPVTAAEYRTFWASCSEADKDYFKNVDLATGLLRV